MDGISLDAISVTLRFDLCLCWNLSLDETKVFFELWGFSRFDHSLFGTVLETFEHFRKRSEQLRSISNTFGPFGDDLTSRSCSSNHAVKISVNIIIG